MNNPMHTTQEILELARALLKDYDNNQADYLARVLMTDLLCIKCHNYPNLADTWNDVRGVNEETAVFLDDLFLNMRECTPDTWDEFKDDMFEDAWFAARYS